MAICVALGIVWFFQTELGFPVRLDFEFKNFQSDRFCSVFERFKFHPLTIQQQQYENENRNESRPDSGQEIGRTVVD